MLFIGDWIDIDNRGSVKYIRDNRLPEPGPNDIYDLSVVSGVEVAHNMMRSDYVIYIYGKLSVFLNKILLSPPPRFSSMELAKQYIDNIMPRVIKLLSFI